MNSANSDTQLTLDARFTLNTQKSWLTRFTLFYLLGSHAKTRILGYLVHTTNSVALAILKFVAYIN